MPKVSPSRWPSRCRRLVPGSHLRRQLAQVLRQWTALDLGTESGIRSDGFNYFSTCPVIPKEKKCKRIAHLVLANVAGTRVGVDAGVGIPDFSFGHDVALKLDLCDERDFRRRHHNMCQSASGINYAGEL